MNNQRIVCAAIKMKDGTVICGPRHFDDIMRNQLMRNQLVWNPEWNRAEQGFVNQYGVFLTREKAYQIAEKNGQIIRDIGYKGNKLFSEHLY